MTRRHGVATWEGFFEWRSPRHAEILFCGACYPSSRFYVHTITAVAASERFCTGRPSHKSSLRKLVIKISVEVNLNYQVLNLTSRYFQFPIILPTSLFRFRGSLPIARCSAAGLSFLRWKFGKHKNQPSRLQRKQLIFSCHQKLLVSHISYHKLNSIVVGGVVDLPCNKEGCWKSLVF